MKLKHQRQKNDVPQGGYWSVAAQCHTRQRPKALGCNRQHLHTVEAEYPTPPLHSSKTRRGRQKKTVPTGAVAGRETQQKAPKSAFRCPQKCGCYGTRRSDKGVGGGGTRRRHRVSGTGYAVDCIDLHWRHSSGSVNRGLWMGGFVESLLARGRNHRRPPSAPAAWSTRTGRLGTVVTGCVGS